MKKGTTTTTIINKIVHECLCVCVCVYYVYVYKKETLGVGHKVTRDRSCNRPCLTVFIPDRTYPPGRLRHISF